MKLPAEQRPRICAIPDYRSSAGEEAVELAAMAGLHLDPWQQFVLHHALGEDDAGRWAAFEVGVDVSRQNGKGGILEARELAGLYLLGEPLIIHSAHQFDTSLEHFRRVLALIEDTPELERRVKRVSRSHGEEGIELNGGQRIRFRTRTKGGGRGFSGDLVVFDEAMMIPQTAHGAILPTLSARSITGNPQVWYTGSAVDQWQHEHGLVFARVRERGIAGDDPRLAYFEWSVDGDNPEQLTPEQAADPANWQAANPGLGIRISAEHVELERRSMDGRTFAVERLGIGDWPSTDPDAGQLIGAEQWRALIDVDSQPLDPLCLAFDVTPDRSAAAIGVAGPREDGRRHVEVVDHHRGTGWVADRIEGLVKRHRPAAVVCDGVGPAAALIAPIERLGVEVVTVNGREYGQACGTFYDAVIEDALRHLDSPELREALRGAAQRTLGDSWAWSRKSSTVDISPLVAVTLALWGSQGEGESVWERRFEEGVSLL